MSGTGDQIDARRPRRSLPIVLTVVLAISTLVLGVIGISLHLRTSGVQSETKRLVATNQRVETRTERERRLASNVDNAITAVQSALTDAQLAQTTLAVAERGLVTAADTAIAQRNTGDLTGSSDTFRTTVTAAADEYDTALAAARAHRDAVAAALVVLDRARRAQS